MLQKLKALNPYFAHILISLLLACGLILFSFLLSLDKHGVSYASTSSEEWLLLVVIIPVLALIIYPFVITLQQCVWLFRALTPNRAGKSTGIAVFDVFTIGLVFLMQWPYLLLVREVMFKAKWTETLVNDNLHQPIWSGSMPSIIAVVIVFGGGFCLLRLGDINRFPPLLTVLAMSASLGGLILCVVWGYQISSPSDAASTLTKARGLNPDVFALLPSFTTIIVILKTLAIKVRDWDPDPDHLARIQSTPVLGRINSLLINAKTWPVFAVLLLLPLLAVLVMILTLFGQAPDSLIKAFTETSDWQLSTQVSPQNVFHDEHYLCTVAAGGHRKIVKPLRKGIRHGHPVTVNRQLLIANAFEDLIMQHTPRFHRFIRDAYDHYGFPIARLIKSRYIADMVWVLMKPLEWFFLCVLYLADTHPEDRIAMQYTGSSARQLKEREAQR